MNVLDIIILVCCVPAIIGGFSKGFVSQAISLVALVLGVWLSFKFSGVVGEWLGTYFDLPDTVMHVIAFAVILILVILVLSLLGKALEAILKVVMLGWLDKLLGVVFGVVKAFLFAGLLIILLDAVQGVLPVIPAETIDGSVFYHPVKDLADLVFPYLKELIFNK